MKTRDYIIFSIGALILIGSYVFDYSKLEFGGFLTGIGYGTMAMMIIKAFILLIPKKKTYETT